MFSSGLMNQSTSWRLYRKVSETLLCSYLGRKVVRAGALIAENSGRNRRDLRFLPPWHSVDLQNNFATAPIHIRSIPAQKGQLLYEGIAESAFFALFCRLLNAANGPQIFLLHGRKILRLIFLVFRLCLLHRLRVAYGSPSVSRASPVEARMRSRFST